MRGRRYTGVVRLLCALGTLCVTFGALTISAAPTARASGGGPCTSLTQSDLAQPQVTAAGRASASLSRTQGTDGTLLSLSGSGWPANTPIALDIWMDFSGTFRGGPMYQHQGGVVSAPVVPIQGTTSASGALQFPRFRLPSGFWGLCQNEMSVNGQPASSVTILFVAHTLDGNYSNGRVRQPIEFTYFRSPTIEASSAGNRDTVTAQVGERLALTGAGWEPGERVTVTPQVATWPTVDHWSGDAVPITPPASPGAMTVTADTAGTLAFTFTVPQVAPLSYIALLLHGNGGRYGDMSFFAFTTYVVLPGALPAIAVDRLSVVAGGTVTVTGDHWQPGQQGTIEYCRGLNLNPYKLYYCDINSAESLGAFQADSAGHFEVPVRLPINARLGDITMQARVNGADVQDTLGWLALARATPMTIVASASGPTNAQLHPQQGWLLAHAPYLGGALALVIALAGVALLIARRRRGGTQAGA